MVTLKEFCQETIQANGNKRYNYKKNQPQVSILCLTLCKDRKRSFFFFAVAFHNLCEAPGN